MYERFRKEKIVEAKIQRLRNAMGVMDTIVTFQNGAWYARHAGSQVSTWRRFGTRLRAVSFSSDLVRAVHARGTGEVARRAKRGRQPSVSRDQSRAWPFACLAFCSTDYRKRETARSLILNRHSDQQPLGFSRLEHAQVTHEHRTTNDSIRKRLLRLRNYMNIIFYRIPLVPLTYK